MKKFIAVVVLLCTVMIHASASAELQPVQLYDQSVFTLIQKLQGFGIKIWNIESHSDSGYFGYTVNFGDNRDNWLVFVVNNNGAVSSLNIITECAILDNPFSTVRQAGKVMGAICIAVGLTIEDVMRIAEEFELSLSNAIVLNPYMTKYYKVFSSYSVKTKRLIEVGIFMEEFRPSVGECRIFIRALA